MGEDEIFDDLEELSETEELLIDTINHAIQTLTKAKEAIEMKNKGDYIAHINMTGELFGNILCDPDIINPDEADAFTLDSKIREYREYITTFSTSKMDIIGLSNDDPNGNNFKKIL